jgi:hypothetical protein
VIVIETVPGLSPNDEVLAAELGPSNVRAEASLSELAERAGLAILESADVTEEFRHTVDRLSRLLSTREELLRDAEGSDAYEAERDKKARMLRGLASGLLRRSLVVAERPLSATDRPRRA